MHSGATYFIGVEAWSQNKLLQGMELMTTSVRPHLSTIKATVTLLFLQEKYHLYMYNTFL